MAYPCTSMVAAYLSLTDIRTFTEAETLDGASVLPGFNCPVAQLFQPTRR